MAILKVENLIKMYGEKYGTKDVSFELKPGEFFGFIGPNGSGKSTTIRCIMGLLDITSGKIEVFDKNIKEVDRVFLNSQIGYVPAESSFYDYMTARQMLEYSAKLKNAEISKIEEYANILELDLSGMISKMSFGNRKKVSIISALLGDSKLLILDEPTSGLDPLIQQRFFEILKDISKNGCTILLSSHNLSEVQKYCDRVAIIKEGTIIAIEDIKEIRKKNLRIVEIHKKDDKKIELTNARMIEEKPDVIKFEHYGSIKELAKDLEKIDPLNVFIEQADLERVFIHYYQRENN